MISCILLLIPLSAHFVTSQTSPSENIVILQSSDQLLQCPISSEDCTNVQWNLITADGEVFVIGNGLNVYEQYRQDYKINSTAGYCMLNIVKATVDATAGHINCLRLDNGKPVKAFHIYTIADGPKCSPNVPSSDGYANLGDTLTYTCDLTYSGGGAGGQVEMVWLSNHLSPVSGVVLGDHKRISSAFEVAVNRTMLPQYVCRLTFGNKNGSTTVVIQDCTVNPVNVRYAVTYVKLSDDGSNAVPGSNVTCTADGIPIPNIRWVESTSGTVVFNDSNFIVGFDSSEMYYCEAWNQLNDQPIRSATVMFNNTFVIVKPQPATFAAWIVPVVICVPLAILLIIIILCLACPVCPLNKSIKDRRNKYPVKEKIRPDERQNGPSIVPLQSSPGAEYPENFSNPRPRPRSTMSNRANLSNDDSFSTQGSLNQSTLTQHVPAPKKALLSGAGAGSSTNDLLYVDVASPASSPDGASRPMRPGAKPQSKTIYTPVLRS